MVLASGTLLTFILYAIVMSITAWAALKEKLLMLLCCTAVIVLFSFIGKVFLIVTLISSFTLFVLIFIIFLRKMSTDKG